MGNITATLRDVAGGAETPVTLVLPLHKQEQAWAQLKACADKPADFKLTPCGQIMGMTPAN